MTIRSESQVKMKTKVIATPWGESDSIEEICDGMYSVTTESHGGFKLENKWNYQIPLEYRNHDGWYEEDVESNIVITFFPEIFGESEISMKIVADFFGNGHKPAKREHKFLHPEVILCIEDEIPTMIYLTLKGNKMIHHAWRQKSRRYGYHDLSSIVKVSYPDLFDPYEVLKAHDELQETCPTLYARYTPVKPATEKKKVAIV